MVSLNPGSPLIRGQQGAFFFGSTNGDPDDDVANHMVIDQPLLGRASSTVSFKQFHKIITTWVAVFEVIVVCAFLGILFIPTAVFKYTVLNDIDPPFSLLAPCHSFIWILFCCSGYFKAYQHRESRRYGYLSFYRSTARLRQIPQLIIAAGNVGVVAVACFCSPWFEPSQCPGFGSDPSEVRNDLLKLITSIECFLIIIVSGIYMYRTCRFNCEALPPDEHENLHVVTEPMQSQDHRDRTLDVNIGQQNSSDVEFVDEMLEKQADVIKYLQGQNRTLTSRVIALTNEVEGAKNSSAGTHNDNEGDASRIEYLEDLVSERDRQILDLRERLQLA